MLYAILGNFVGGTSTQYSLIIKDFGFSVLQTTLLNIPSGAHQIIFVTFGMWMLHKYPVSTPSSLYPISMFLSPIL
jgi:hypothetical protein